MTQKQFNDKYKQFVPQGWYGLEFEIEGVTDYLDKIMQDMVRIPGFELHQIKLKFGRARFYFETSFFNKELQHAISLKVEEQINRLVESQDKEYKLDSRMDVIGQNGNEGLHYEEDWMDKEYKDGYERTLKSGMFWEWYPNLTGVWEQDKYAFCHELKQIQDKINRDDKETK